MGTGGTAYGAASIIPAMGADHATGLANALVPKMFAGFFTNGANALLPTMFAD